MAGHGSRLCPQIQSHDVLPLEHSMIEGHMDLIWASPPYTHYSILRTTARTPRDIGGSERLVRNVLDLSDQLFAYYFMENPQSGLLKSRDVVAGLPTRAVDFCRYADADLPHRAVKRTAIWTSTDWVPPLCNKDCGHCDSA